MTYFYLIEQHVDKSWWYHPQFNPYNSIKEAEKGFKKQFWYELDRPHRVIETTSVLPKKTLCSWDCEEWFNCFGVDKYKVELL